MTAADTIRDIEVEVKRCAECGTRFGREAQFCPFCGIALAMAMWDPTRDPLVGKVIDGRYEVVSPVGEGGMGTVYRVRHVTLDRHFAMKVLRPELASDPDLSSRFMQEARATAAIRHPSVVQITDFGALADGAPYFVMELLVGETLATRIRGRGLMSGPVAVSLARSIADALHATHLAHVVHRDLKPENVFLLGQPTSPKNNEEAIRIVDFGAAKVVGSSKRTRPGVVFGTPYYMSPEQASGQPVDPRADIYSLGVVLFEMLTGTVPFEADTYMGVLTKHMFQKPPTLAERVSTGVLQAPELEAIVERALAKEPERRFQSMAELIAAFDAYLRQSSKGTARMPMLHTPNAPRHVSSETGALLRAGPPMSGVSGRTVLLTAGAAAVTVAVGAIVLTLHGRTRVPTGPAPEGRASSASVASSSPARSVASPDPPPTPSPSAVLTVSSEPSVLPPVTTAPSPPGAPTSSARSSASVAPRPGPSKPSSAVPAARSATPTKPGGADFRDPWAP